MHVVDASNANAMGPGVVSMSFGSLEGSWATSADSAFTASNMTYLAATGDSGAAVSWPAVSSKVVAVGGTTLSYSGTGVRTEATWSGTGGGISLYTLAPSYQTTAVPGMATYRGRSVADVAFNADPASGQYVATLAPGTGTVRWISAGGTSLACPQWAGLFAIANAPVVNSANISGNVGKALSFAIKASGANPLTYTLSAAPSGMVTNTTGTVTWANPVAGTFSVVATAKDSKTSLSGQGFYTITISKTGLVIAAPAVSGVAGKVLRGGITISAPGATYISTSITGAPWGMSFSSSGLVINYSWASPVTGNYSLAVTVSDSTGQTARATIPITIRAK